MVKYILIIKKITAIKLITIFINDIISKYKSSKGIIFDRNLIFINAF